MENMNNTVNEVNEVQAAPELVTKCDTKVIDTIAEYLLDEMTCCGTGSIQERVDIGIKKRAVEEPTNVRSMMMTTHDIMRAISWYCREQDPSSTVVPNNQLIRDVAIKFNELLLAEEGYNCLAYLYRQEIVHVLAKGDMLSPVVALHQAAAFKPWVYDKLVAYAIRVTENGVEKYHGDTYQVKRKDDVQSANRDVFEDNGEFVAAYYDPHVATIMASLIQDRMAAVNKTVDIAIVPINLTFMRYSQEDVVYQDRGIKAFFIPKHMFTEYQSQAIIEVDGGYSGCEQIENKHGVDLRLVGKDKRTLVYAASGLKGRENAGQVSRDLYDDVMANVELRDPFVFDHVIDTAVFGSNYTLYYIVNDTKDLKEDTINKEFSVDQLLALESRVREFINDHGHVYVTAHRLASETFVDFLPFKNGYYYLNHAYLTHLFGIMRPLSETYHSKKGNDYFVSLTKSHGCDRDEAVDIGMPLMRECYRLSVDEIPEWLKLRGLTLVYWKPGMDYFHGGFEVSSYPIAEEDASKEVYTNSYFLCVDKHHAVNADKLFEHLSNHPLREYLSVFSYATSDQLEDFNMWRRDYVKDIERLIKREVEFTDDISMIVPPDTTIEEVIVSEDAHGYLYLSVEELGYVG